MSYFLLVALQCYKVANARSCCLKRTWNYIVVSSLAQRKVSKLCEGQITIKMANEAGNKLKPVKRFKELLLLCYNVFWTKMLCFFHNTLACYKRLRKWVKSSIWADRCCVAQSLAIVLCFKWFENYDKYVKTKNDQKYLWSSFPVLLVVFVWLGTCITL